MSASYPLDWWRLWNFIELKNELFCIQINISRRNFNILNCVNWFLWEPLLELAIMGNHRNYFSYLLIIRMNRYLIDVLVIHDLRDWMSKVQLFVLWLKKNSKDSWPEKLLWFRKFQNHDYPCLLVNDKHHILYPVEWIRMKLKRW